MTVQSYPETSEWVDATLQFKIQTAGHRDPFPPGTPVVFVYDVPNFYIFDELDHHDAWKMMADRDPKHCHIVNKQADVGLVVGHTFHASKDEVWKATDSFYGGSYDVPPRMGSAYKHMWYNIALPSGLFWARYNWIEKYQP